MHIKELKQKELDILKKMQKESLVQEQLHNKLMTSHEEFNRDQQAMLIEK